MTLQSRPLRSRRKIAPEHNWETPDVMRWIIRPLNNDGFERGYVYSNPRQVKQVLTLLVQIAAIAQAMRYRQPSDQEETPLWLMDDFSAQLSFDPESVSLQRLGNKRIRALNELLSQYRWSPRMNIGKGYVFERRTHLPRSRRTAHFRECMAIDWLLRDAELGRMYRYKVCPECKKWFYTLTDHQRFCGDPCRKRYASHSDEYKTKRCEYMRRYRQDQKALNDTALERAKSGRL
jgi:hypothetical protein